MEQSCSKKTKHCIGSFITVGKFFQFSDTTNTKSFRLQIHIKKQLQTDIHHQKQHYCEIKTEFPTHVQGKDQTVNRIFCLPKNACVFYTLYCMTQNYKFFLSRR